VIEIERRSDGTRSTAAIDNPAPRRAMIDLAYGEQSRPVAAVTAIGL
jgi:hypothetical protein